MIEGPAAIADLLASGATLEELYVDAETWAEAFTRAGDDDPFVVTVDRAAASGAPVWSLGRGVIDSVSDTVSPQGMLAVAPRRSVAIDELAAGTGPVLVLVDVADPGNAGTLVRSAEAAGAAGVVFAGRSTDPFGPKAVRAAAGSLLRLPIAECDSIADALLDLQAAGRILLATVVDGGVPPEQLDLTAPIALLIGSEAHGLTEEVIGACDHRVTVPVAAAVESLNAAVAGSVVLFEASRQRRVR